MKGFEDDWIQLKPGEHSMRYTHLPPGGLLARRGGWPPRETADHQPAQPFLRGREAGAVRTRA